jgi:hypothetical protein
VSTYLSIKTKSAVCPEVYIPETDFSDLNDSNTPTKTYLPNPGETGSMKLRFRVLIYKLIKTRVVIG